MKIPPWLVRVQFPSLTLWLPLVLFWPLVLLVLVPVLLVGVVVSIFTEGPTFPEFRRFCGGLYQVLCALPGTSVSLDAPRAHIAFTLY